MRRLFLVLAILSVGNCCACKDKGRAAATKPKPVVAEDIEKYVNEVTFVSGNEMVRLCFKGTISMGTNHCTLHTPVGQNNTYGPQPCTSVSVLENECKPYRKQISKTDVEIMRNPNRVIPELDE